MKNTLSGIIMLLCFISCSSPETKENWHVVSQPAEFEAQDAIWLIWPSTDHKAGASVEEVVLSVIAALIEETRIVVTCRDAALLSQAKAKLRSHFGDRENLVLLVLPSYEIWVRDMGPVFVRTNRQTMAIADFNFNSWGYSDTLAPDTKTEEMFDVRAAGYLDLPVISSPMISEGGNREVNGKGTLITTESVEAGRNPHMTKQEMEGEYRSCWA